MENNTTVYALGLVHSSAFILMVLSIVLTACAISSGSGIDALEPGMSLALIFGVIMYISMKLHENYRMQQVKEECYRLEYMGRY